MRNEKPHAECERSRQLRNSKMPPSLAHAIGAPAENEHADQACHKRNRAHPANALNVRPTGESLEHRRKPKPKRVPTGIGEEQPGSEHQHRWMSKRLPNRDLLRVRLRAVLINEPVREINNHAGEKSRFGRAKQKSRAVKLPWCSHETSQGCQCAPRDQR